MSKNEQPTPEPTWTSDLHALLPHLAEPQLLLLPGDNGWRLPHRQVAEHLWATAVGRATDFLQQAMALPGEALRYVHYRRDEETHHVEALFVFTNDDAGWQPPSGACWVDAAALTALALAREEQRPYLESYLAELAGAPPPPHRAPWTRPEWPAEARAWASETLAGLGRPLTGPLKLIRSWSITSMLRGPTAAGDVYFKATRDLPLFVDEGRVQTGLAAWFPGEVPPPLATHPNHNWMVTADFGATLDWESPPEKAVEVYRRYCRLQQATAVDPDRLLTLGCHDRRPSVLATQIEPAMDVGFPLSQLTAEEKSDLRALLPWLKEACAAVETFAVPPTLVHGDLHFANVAEDAGQYSFYDWSDACLAHPFFDTIKIAYQSKPDDAEWLRKRYLELWTEHESLKRLGELWTLAQPLSALHQAVSYVHIVANIEAATQHELNWGLDYWFRQVLATAREAAVTAQ